MDARVGILIQNFTDNLFLFDMRGFLLDYVIITWRLCKATEGGHKTM